MRANLFTLLCVSTGAFVYWMLSGFKGKFDDYMSRYSDSDYKYAKNYWTGFAILIFILLNVLAVMKR